jgi:hypothetical protein
VTRDDINAFLHAYLACALLTTSEDDKPLVEHKCDWSEDALLEARVECEAFIDQNIADLANIDSTRAGHDFWLTRSGHGTGFWDRDLDEVGDRLTEACDKNFGEATAYIGDDRKIYFI